MVSQTKQRRRWMRSNVGRYFDSPRPRTRIRQRHGAAVRAHQDADGFSARARYKIGMRELRAELIDCHDCRRPPSFLTSVAMLGRLPHREWRQLDGG
jgi:hypothetical protein